MAKRYLRKVDDPTVYGWNEPLAKRGDMIPCTKGGTPIGVYAGLAEDKKPVQPSDMVKGAPKQSDDIGDDIKAAGDDKDALEELGKRHFGVDLDRRYSAAKMAQRLRDLAAGKVTDAEADVETPAKTATDDGADDGDDWMG